jgi:hypothetical protein
MKVCNLKIMLEKIKPKYPNSTCHYLFKWRMHFVLQNRSGLFVFVLCFASLDIQGMNASGMGASCM